MDWERRPAEWLRRRQDEALASYIGRDVYPYSRFYRPRFDAAGLAPRTVKSRQLLRRLPLTTLADVEDPRHLVLQPDEASIQRFGPPGLVTRVFFAKVRGTQSRVNHEVLDVAFKPVHWHVADGVPIGSSAEDVERLAELGRRWLEHAGVGRHDVMLGMLPPGPNLPYWQLVWGCQRAGLSALHLAPPATVEQLTAVGPTVLAGRPTDLLELLEACHRAGRSPHAVRTVLVAGSLLDDATRSHLAGLLPNPDAAVVAAWAPPGVRALWSECRHGRGLHTWPDSELVEVVEPTSALPLDGGRGAVVWSALGWRGSVLLRLRTPAIGELDESPCPACGRTTPRLRLEAGEPAFATVLDANRAVSAWQAELRQVGGRQELVVFVSLALDGHPGPVLRELDRTLHATQYVVLERPELERRVASHGGQRVVDTR